MKWENKVQFEHLGEDEPPLGIVKHDELKTSGVLDVARSEISAHVAVYIRNPEVIVTDDEVHQFYGGSAGTERTRDEMTEVNQSAENRGARSSHEMPAPMRPAINIRGEGLKLLASELAKELALASQDGLHSEQNSPQSDQNMCTRCYEPKIVHHDSVKFERCTCDENDLGEENDTEPDKLVGESKIKLSLITYPETAILNRLRGEIITECMDC